MQSNSTIDKQKEWNKNFYSICSSKDFHWIYYRRIETEFLANRLLGLMCYFELACIISKEIDTMHLILDNHIFANPNTRYVDRSLEDWMYHINEPTHGYI